MEDKKSFWEKLRIHITGLSFRIISGTVMVLLIFGLMLSFAGYAQFTRSLTREYNESAFRTAETAATLVDGDHIQEYLDTNGETEEYQVLRDRLDTLCQKQNVTLTKMTAENKRISTELSIARKIQAEILPHEFPPFPDRHEFDIYASMAPAKEVGGDFYDFYMLDREHLGMVIADVSGKGVPAALFMMIAKLLIKLRAHSGGDPGDMLTDVSHTLCERNPMGLFVTVWFAIIDVMTGEGIAVNAGHENPVLRHKNGEYELVKYRHLPPLATFDDIKYKSHEFTLQKGDSLFLYTDGVTEAEDIGGEMFGEDRILKALNRDSDADPKHSLQNVKQEIDAFAVEAEQFDDITMLGMRYNGIE